MSGVVLVEIARGLLRQKNPFRLAAGRHQCPSADVLARSRCVHLRRRPKQAPLVGLLNAALAGGCPFRAQRACSLKKPIRILSQLSPYN